MTGRGTVAVMAVLAALAGCSTGAGAAVPSSVDTVELTIYGAASLKDALAAIETTYETAIPGIALTVATDSSATLRTQIEEGAPADVYLAADEKNPQALVDRGLADGDPVAFAANRLTIVVPADNPAAIGSPADLARPGVKVVAAGDAVPITTYATQAVVDLAGQPGYGAVFVEAYARNVVSKEENVRAVVAKIELGEGDAAIVYVTDARAAAGVATIEIPPPANVLATYAGVVLKATARPSEAHAFLDWLAGPGGSAILAGFGFLPPAS